VDSRRDDESRDDSDPPRAPSGNAFPLQHGHPDRPGALTYHEGRHRRGNGGHGLSRARRLESTVVERGRLTALSG
jgi:hypothetical protein